jgi:hypothetical protein
MLSDDSINRLIQPLIDRQESINTYVITMIAKRVREIGSMNPSDLYKIERLVKSGSDIRLINAELARLASLQVKEIKSILKTVAVDNYMDAKPLYDYRHKSFIPYEKNKPLQKVVTAISNQTAGTYKNISKAQAFMVRDLKNPQILKPTSISKTYQSIIDEAVQAAQSGVIDYNTAIRRSLKQLNESGIRYVTYQAESGKVHSQRLDTAVRRNILDGIRAINQGVEDETGKQYGADGKELSVHAFPAPDHAPVQGHQFRNEEYEKMQNGEGFTDVKGNKFEGFDRAIGTLNCRHFAYSIIVGYSKPRHTDKYLSYVLTRNEEGYTTSSGKHLTMYQCTQQQRRLETEIRKAKDGQIMARESGDRKLAEEYQAKINKYTNEYKVFSNACGLKTQNERQTVSGYHPISTSTKVL